MRTSLLISFLFATVALHAQSKLNKGFKTYKVFPAKKLVLHMDDSFSFSASVEKGDMLLFEYVYQADEYADMTDDEYVERVLFTVPKNTSSFETDIVKLNAAYMRGCFCVDRGWHRVKDGFVKAKKINSKTWEVEITATTEKEPDRSAGPISIDVKGRYMLQPVPKKPLPKKKTRSTKK